LSNAGSIVSTSHDARARAYSETEPPLCCSCRTQVKKSRAHGLLNMEETGIDSTKNSSRASPSALPCKCTPSLDLRKSLNTTSKISSCPRTEYAAHELLNKLLCSGRLSLSSSLSSRAKALSRSCGRSLKRQTLKQLSTRYMQMLN